MRRNRRGDRKARTTRTLAIAAKQVAEAKQLSEERFRTAFEHAPYGMCLSTLGAQLLRANRTLCQMLGYSEDELIAMGWMGITHPDDRSMSLDMCKKLQHDEPECVDFEKRYIRKDGSVLWARVRISISTDCERSWDFVTHIEDITNAKRARESLRRSEEKYRRLVSNLPDVVWSSNREGSTTYISPNIQAISGYTPEEIYKGGQELWSLSIHSSDRSRVIDAYRMLIQNGLAFDLEYRIRRKDGEWIWVHHRAARTGENDDEVFADHVFSDVTSRRQTEAALKQSEEHYRLLFERNLAGVFRALPDETLIDCNEALLRLLDYGSRAEFLAHRASQIFYNADEQHETFDALYRDGRLTNHDVRLRKRDGSPVWVLENVSLLKDEHSRPAFIEGTLIDISARKLAEQKLRESEEKYRTLVTNIPDAVWTVNSDGHLVFISPNCKDIYGYTQEELQDPHIWPGIIHSEDRPRVHDAYIAFINEGRPFNVEYRCRRKDGQYAWIRGQAFHSYEKGGARYADGCAFDITEQKINTQLVEKLQQRTELILNSAGEGIIGVDPEGRVTFANPAAARMLGCATTDLVGEALQQFLLYYNREVDRGPERSGMLECLVDGKERRGMEGMLRPRIGDDLAVEYTSTPKFEDGRLAGMVVVFRDITEARRANERIAASLGEKEALLREIHHRVKNNLQIVSSLLRLNSQALNDPMALHIFEETRHRIKAMALVHETLYRSGDLAGINFSVYVPQLTDHLLHTYGLSRREVRVSFDVNSLVFPIDTAIPCALVFTELISNSAKHAFVTAGGGELRITFAPFEPGFWLLRVEDSGCSNPDVPRPPGQPSSFGLELVKLLSEQLDGKMIIERKPGFV